MHSRGACVRMPHLCLPRLSPSQDSVPALEIPTAIADANEAQATEAYAHAWCRFVGVCCNLADEDDRVGFLVCRDCLRCRATRRSNVLLVHHI